MRATRLIAAVTAAVMAMTLSGCGRTGWQSELVTVNASGSDAAGQLMGGYVFSPDGTKVVFATNSSDLGSTDSNGTVDVYLRDLAAGTTTLVSVNAAGNDSGNDYSWEPQFSPDGTKIAFVSGADDLHPIGVPGSSGIYVRDLVAGTTTPVSVNNAGTEISRAYQPRFSPDGTKIAFTTTASWLGPRDTNSLEDIYMRDMAAGTTTLVSVNAAGTDALGYSFNPGFAPVGDKVVFEQASEGLMLRDLSTAATTMLAEDASGPFFTPDGSKVAFTSSSPNLGHPDTNNGHDAYVLDLSTGETALISVNAAGTDSGNAWSYANGISADGTKVLLSSDASNLGPKDTNGKHDIYLRDLRSGTTSLVSSNAAGTDSGNDQAINGSMTPDGDKAVFVSGADDLGPADTTLCKREDPPNPPYFVSCNDVFVRDLVTGEITVVSVKADGTDTANADSTYASIVPGSSGRTVGFRTSAGDLGPIDTNGAEDVYVATLRSRPRR